MVVAYTTGDINAAAKTSPHVPRGVVRPAVWLVSPHFIQAAISLTARKPPLSGRYFLISEPCERQCRCQRQRKRQGESYLTTFRYAGLSPGLGGLDGLDSLSSTAGRTLSDGRSSTTGGGCLPASRSISSVIS